MRKYCVVPTCPNNSSKCPNLIFLSVPCQPERRQKWENVLNVPLQKTKFYTCCEVHFDLPNDARNWCNYSLIGTRIILKPDVVPHLNMEARSSASTQSQLTSSARKRKQEAIKKFKASLRRKKICLDENDSSGNKNASPLLTISTSSGLLKDESDALTYSQSELDLEDLEQQQERGYLSTAELFDESSCCYLGLP